MARMTNNFTSVNWHTYYVFSFIKLKIDDEYDSAIISSKCPSFSLTFHSEVFSENIFISLKPAASNSLPDEWKSVEKYFDTSVEKNKQFYVRKCMFSFKQDSLFTNRNIYISSLREF